jgi:SAM-dependent methyltransferase
MTSTTHDDGWVAAGAAWGHAAPDWAYLFEPYARDAADHLFDLLGVGPLTMLFDMACGGGYATARAARRGAAVAGLDASAELIDIARRRTPAGDFTVGTMFDLPYADASFDVVTSFNGLWGGCDGALKESFRVLRPGGHVAFTFWGPGHTLDFREMFIALGGATADARDEMISLASIGSPGTAEAMLSGAGFELVVRGETEAIHELPDDDAMWRCLRSPGLMVPALEQLGDTQLRELLMATIEPCRSDDGSYRVTNQLTHVVGKKP